MCCTWYLNEGWKWVTSKFQRKILYHGEEFGLWEERQNNNSCGKSCGMESRNQTTINENIKIKKRNYNNQNFLQFGSE